MATKQHGPKPAPIRNLLRVMAVATFALIGASCQGDTLYDDVVEGEGPTLLIERPITGGQVQRGRRIPVRILAVDSIGVTQVELVWTGVETGRIEIPIVPPQIGVAIDTAFTVTTGSTGGLELRAVARNGRGVIGRSDAVSLSVTAGDEIAPEVAIEANVPPRMELTDSIRVRVTARDNEGGSGLSRVGFTALVRTEGSTELFVFDQSATFSPTESGTVVRDFAFVAPLVDARSIPRTLSFEFHAFALDSASNCASNTNQVLRRLSCTQITAGSGTYTISGGAAIVSSTTVTAGRSFSLPTGSDIADAVADVNRERLYLSNFGRNRIEVFDIRNRSFGSPTVVGSQPWGIAMNRSNDTLIVANSGGTNVSFIPLGSGTLTEAVARRINTPNAVLFQVERQRDFNFVERLQVRFFDFSDRPQFIAQDAAGRLLYSTVPTDAAPNGTIRLGQNQQGWASPEVRILIGRGVFEVDTTNVSILNVDSMRVFSTGATDVIEIYDHRQGFPGTIVRSGPLPLDSAIAVMVNHPDSDIDWAPGRYVLDLVGLSDTTFVAASADRQRIAFGEGSIGNGRILLWKSQTATLSNEITVADLVGNASEHILGLHLNFDGTLGAVRGTSAAYFFKNDDLRLQGMFAAPVPLNGGGSGAGLHPQHPSYSSYPPSGASTLAFVADDQRIRIVDTVHFTERGRIEVRDRIVGPLRVSPPLPGDNTGCTGGDCIVARVYAVTSAGAVVLVEVRGRDIQ